MTATVRPSPLVDGEFSAWCREHHEGSGFGHSEADAQGWADDHNQAHHAGEAAATPTLNLTAAASVVIQNERLGEPRDGLWEALTGLDETAAYVYAEQIADQDPPVRAAVVPF